MVTPTDPVFAGYNVSPKRISAMLVVSRQLLVQQTGPELDRILIGDISRQLASYLEQCALYGDPAANQPTGLVNVPGVNQPIAIDPADLHGSFCALEERIEAANVSLDSYGVIVSPATRKILRTTHRSRADQLQPGQNSVAVKVRPKLLTAERLPSAGTT